MPLRRGARGRALWLALVAVACDGAPPSAPDDAGDAALSTDVGTDTALDAALPAFPRFCSLCHRDVDCGGGLCLALGTDGRERACGVTCSSDIDCTRIGLDASCVEVVPGLPRQCTPRSGTCLESAPGTACSDTAPCSGTFDLCHSFYREAPVCTARCRVSADCPLGMRTCETSSEGALCVPDRDDRPTHCGAPSSREPSPICACGAEPSTTLASTTLAAAGLDACDLRIASEVLEAFGPEVAHDRYHLDLTDRLRAYAPEIPRTGDAIARALDDAATSSTPVTDALFEAATLADLVPVDPVVPTRATDAVVELLALATTAGATPDTEYVRRAITSLPVSLQGTLAPLFRALHDALLAREEALAGISASARQDLFDLPSALFLPGLALVPSLVPAETQGPLLGDVAVERLARTAIDLAATIEGFSLLRFATETPHLLVDTPAGAIVLTGGSDDIHDHGPILLLVDFGGNDVYRGTPGATASATNGISVVIDVAGTDRYEYARVPVPADTSGPVGSHRLASDGRGRATASANNGPLSLSTISRQGAGRLGIGMLFDLGTEGDTYEALRMSQGYGALGVGVLYDAGGDDVYVGEAAVQGAASFGIGLQLDADGDDRYVAYAFSQGFGYVRGVGTLYDGHGTDEYVADAIDVLYFSPQAPGLTNSSFSQGAGFGRRADTSADVAMSGGVGVLRDRDGRDLYSAGVFAQGTGYWGGVGLLLEGAGDDRYDGWWYVHGAAAHFAIAALLDAQGDDVYQVANPDDPARATSIGVGHDLSIGWLLDRDGNDTYHAPGLSLGSGNAAGIGLFVDGGGVDDYRATGDFSFGNASIETVGDPVRGPAGTIGLFVDRGGDDLYARPNLAPVAQNATWQQFQHDAITEHGAGSDSSTGEIGLGLDPP